MKSKLTVIYLMLTGIFLFAEASRAIRDYAHIKHRPKPREIRGFKPEYISTAIGFGKRDDSAGFISENNDLSETTDSMDMDKLDARDRIFMFLRNLPRGIPLRALLDDAKVKPVVVGRITRTPHEIEEQTDQANNNAIFDPERTVSIL